MVRSIMRSTVFVSLAGHLVIFYLFSFSFGRPGSIRTYAPVFFWGQVLPSQLVTPQAKGSAPKVRDLAGITQGRTVAQAKRDYFKGLVVDLKPAAHVSAYALRAQPPLEIPAPAAVFVQRKEPTITFYPLLPYGFQLYFKDRQTVHIEVAFNIIAHRGKSSVAVRRKISSGNLVADLLSTRYISHYLFIQQARFVPNTWQTVKIDLSP